MYKKRTLEGVIFSIFSISFGLWALSIYITLLSSSLFWSRTAFLGAILGIGSLFIFSCIFPGNRYLSKKQLLAITFIPIFLSLNIYTDMMIRTVDVVNNSITGTFGPLMIIYQIFSPIYIFGSMYIIFKKYKTSPEQEKNKLRYVLLGISLFVGPAVITNAVLPLWFKIYSLNSLGPIFSILMIVSISYAIIRHQFLDIKIVIQRGIIYSILLTTITGVYVFFVFSFELFFSKSNETSVFISALITTLVGIFGVPPLKKYFQKKTDRIFFKNAYDYKEVLSSLTDALNTNIVLDSITEKTANILKQSVKAETVIFSFEKSAPKEDNCISLPIQSNKKIIGNLILGKKRSGDPYTQEDISLLTTFTKQAGTALEKASLYKQVKEYARTLEQKVEERTREIVAIQKEQETLMLEISHGLQTPLTIMKGELFFLRKQGYDNERVDNIDTSIDRISSFIYRFLSLSKLDTTVSSEKIKINLSSLLLRVVSFFEKEAEEKGIEIFLEAEEDILMEGNKEELEELFSNLINNSIKYMAKEGKREIHLRLTEDTTSIIVMLQDTGIGIRAEHIPNLFKKFYRVKESETKGIQGTGLGLVICKKIIDLHQGTINVNSTFGEGSTFTITFPKIIRK